jgi:class 3 adenylate cyclase
VPPLRFRESHWDELLRPLWWPHRRRSGRRPVRARQGHRDGLGDLNARLTELHGISLQVRIGLHTGVVVVGEMGAGEAHAHHEIVGEMPHIAARLESIAPPGSVLISDTTREFITGYFETEPMGERTLSRGWRGRWGCTGCSAPPARSVASRSRIPAG